MGIEGSKRAYCAPFAKILTHLFTHIRTTDTRPWHKLKKEKKLSVVDGREPFDTTLVEDHLTNTPVSSSSFTCIKN